jgi:hypothetical protein
MKERGKICNAAAEELSQSGFSSASTENITTTAPVTGSAGLHRVSPKDANKC